MRQARIIFSILLTIVVLIPSDRTWAFQDSECKKLTILEWQEARSEHFTFIYSVGSSQTAQGIYRVYAGLLDEEYAQFSNLFEVDLELPISIRVYPDEVYYGCLNLWEPSLRAGQLVARIGAREISFIESRFSQDMLVLKESLLNNFRSELGHMFMDRATDSKAPPGLVAGVQLYAQDPYWLFKEVAFIGTGYDAPSQSWRYLWENESSANNPVLQQGALSIVAYLVDAYGWPKFSRFIRDLATTIGYRQSLVDIYDIEFSKLQDQWEQYYPLYFQGRWQAHAFYAYDLNGIEMLLQRGAFNDAIQRLKEAMSFLEKTQQAKEYELAKGILQRAKAGEEAGNLVAQARQALQMANYTLCIELVNEAELKYEQIGDGHRLEEIALYRSKAQQALNLRYTAEELQQQLASTGYPVNLAVQLAGIGEQLATLGDQQGVANIQQSLLRVDVEQENQKKKLNGQMITIVLVLLAIRLLLLVLKPRGEVL